MRTSIVWRAARSVVDATRLLRRDPREALLSARMAVWVVLVSCLARAMSLPRAHRLVSTRLRAANPDTSADTPARLARAIDRVLKLDVFVFRRSCWRRALVLQRFLALHGIESRVNFGLKKTTGELQGHAWLERDGQPFLEDDAGAYVITFSLPRQPASWESCSRS
ncbi:MAG: lasso peptide biosynthesis B2 protein [Vicinamibacteraceae bacterium]